MRCDQTVLTAGRPDTVGKNSSALSLFTRFYYITCDLLFYDPFKYSQQEKPSCLENREENISRERQRKLQTGNRGSRSGAERKSSTGDWESQINTKNECVYMHQALKEDVYICCELFSWGNDVYMYEKVLSSQSLLFKSVLALTKNKVLLSRLHYCNALLAGLPASSIKPLQLMQNAAARLIFNEPKRTHVTPLFINLHWLPISAQCIKFKALMFAYRTTSGSAPLYLNSLLQTYVPSRSLRSASERRITVPSQRDTKSLSQTFTLTVPTCPTQSQSPSRNG